MIQVTANFLRGRIWEQSRMATGSAATISAATAPASTFSSILGADRIARTIGLAALQALVRTESAGDLETFVATN
jgi:hypothetical protein